MTGDEWARVLPTLSLPHTVGAATMIAFWTIYRTKISTTSDRAIQRLTQKLQNSPIPTTQESAERLLANRASWEEKYPQACSQSEVKELWDLLARLVREAKRFKWWLLLPLGCE